jgi:ketosteroid isomerase-like protein
VSQENVETLRTAWEAFNTGDPTVFLDRYDQDILLHVVGQRFMTPGTFVGAGAVERWFDDFYRSFSRGLQAVPLEFVEAGDSVIVSINQAAKGRVSGAKVEGRVESIFTFRGGSIIRIDLVESRNEALKAVGLEE